MSRLQESRETEKAFRKELALVREEYGEVELAALDLEKERGDLDSRLH